MPLNTKKLSVTYGVKNGTPYMITHELGTIWANLLIPGGRYGFNVIERRWSYNNEPDNFESWEQEFNDHTAINETPIPLTGVYSIKNIAAEVERFLINTELWSEYTSEEDGSEKLEVFKQKYFKNGKPYKNPTLLITLAYMPNKYGTEYNDETDEINEVIVGKRVRPYLVDSVNYGTISTASRAYMEKLQQN